MRFAVSQHERAELHTRIDRLVDGINTGHSLMGTYGHVAWAVYFASLELSLEGLQQIVDAKLTEAQRLAAI